MKAKINTSHINNELRGSSLHFLRTIPSAEEEKKQTDLPANLQTRKEVSQQTSKPIKKFSSYLREDSVKALKRRAVEVDKKDYEILQEAVDLYFASLNKN
jgi:hypothetical protein